MTAAHLFVLYWFGKEGNTVSRFFQGQIQSQIQDQIQGEIQIKRKLKRKRKQKWKRGNLREWWKRPRAGVFTQFVDVFVFGLIHA